MQGGLRINGQPVGASGGGAPGRFGSEFVQVSTSDTDTASGSSWETHLTLNTPNVPAGTYLITVTYKLSGSSGVESEVRVRLDNTFTLYRDGEETESTSTKQSAKGYSLVEELSAGTHTIKIQLRNTKGGQTRVRDGRILFWRVS